MEKVYKVAEVAESLKVDKSTVMKWLAVDEPEYAVIPPAGRFRLPNGHIRIREEIFIKLRKGEL